MAALRRIGCRAAAPCEYDLLMERRRVSSLGSFGLALALSACGASSTLGSAPPGASSPPTVAQSSAVTVAPPPAPISASILADADRSAEDRQLDAGRKPVELF